MENFHKFLLSMVKIGCIGFGGGSALIPVIEEEVITTQHLDTKENYDKDVVAASITPGALPVEISASLGKRSFGYKGMILGAVMMALPGTVGALLMFTILSAVQARAMVAIKLASVGVSAFIICLLLNYIAGVWKTHAAEGRKHAWKTAVVIGAVFILACGGNVYKLIGIEHTPVFSVPTIHILLASFFFVFYTRSDYSRRHLLIALPLCGIYFLGHGKAQLIQSEIIMAAVSVVMVCLSLMGLMQNINQENWKGIGARKDILKDTGVWCVFLLALSAPVLVLYPREILFLGKGLLSAAMSFGGGDAYLTIADGLFVSGGMISPDVYYGEIVPVVNLLPGSILCKTLAGVGYYLGIQVGGTPVIGILFAIAGFSCSIAASGIAFFAIYHMYDNLNSLYAFRMIGRWIRPIIGGLLLNIILSLMAQSSKVEEYTGISSAVVLCTMAILAAADYFLMNRMKMKPVLVLLLDLVLVFGLNFLR